MIEAVGIVLGGFALDVHPVGEGAPERVPVKRLRPLARLAQQEIRIVHARPTSTGATLAFSDGETSSFDARFLLGGGVEGDGIDMLVHSGLLATLVRSGEDRLGLIPDGAVAIRGGRIVAVGRESELRQSIKVTSETVYLDAGGRLVTPGLIDAHTHPVFAGHRAAEFGLRTAGKSYAEIQAAGGGILSTVRATRAASNAELLASLRERLGRLLRWGVTTIEGKSGYALLPEGELALLDVLAQGSACHPVDISATLLAHLVPPEYADRRSSYVDLFAHHLVPKAAQSRCADACDVYCEKDAFTLDETHRILGAAKEAGLALRVHADQFTPMGGAELAAVLQARSADHLEHVSDAAIGLMARAGVVATLLPGAALTLRLLDAGVPVALATDLNPGTSMTESLPFMMSLGCTQMRMSVPEVWEAVTSNAARALGRADLGRLTPGARADLCIFSCDDPAYVPYHYATNHLWAVVKQGEVAWPVA